MENDMRPRKESGFTKLIELSAYPDQCRDFEQKGYALSQERYNRQHTGMIMGRAIRPLIQVR